MTKMRYWLETIPTCWNCLSSKSRRLSYSKKQPIKNKSLVLPWRTKKRRASFGLRWVLQFFRLEPEKLFTNQFSNRLEIFLHNLKMSQTEVCTIKKTDLTWFRENDNTNYWRPITQIKLNDNQNCLLDSDLNLIFNKLFYF